MQGTSSALPDASRRNVVGLDLVRFLTALMVLAYHHLFWARVGASDGHQPLLTLPSLPELTWFGWVGVDVFFVLSGFVIFYSASAASPLDFVRSRILRLAPTIWICATVTVFVSLLFVQIPPNELVSRYLNTIVLYPRGPWIDIVYWTLAVEAAFYLMVFLCIALLPRDRLVHAIVLAGLASTAFWLARAGLGQTPFFRWAEESHTLRLLLVLHGCHFALGAMICHVSGRRPSGREAAIIGVLVLGCMTEVHFKSATQQLPVDVASVFHPTAAFVWATLAFGICLSGRYAEAILRLPDRWLRTIRYLGLLTYPLYLIHNVNGVVLERHLLALSVPPAVAVLLTLAASLAAACLVETLCEPKVKRLLASGLDPVFDYLRSQPRLARLGRRMPGAYRTAGAEGPVPS